MTTKLKFNKGRLIENPIGKTVSMVFKGIEYVGTVLAADYCDMRGVIELTVKDAAGNSWPIKPTALFVNVVR